MLNWTAFGLLAAVLVPAAVMDWRTGRIANWLTYPAILAGLALWTLAGLVQSGSGGAVAGLGQSALWMAAAALPFLVLFALGGIGGGDVKLMAAVGAIGADPWLVFHTGVGAVVVAFVMAVGLMVRRRIVARTLRRLLGAALMAAARVKPDLPTDSPRVPFGAAICVAGLVAGLEHLLRVRMPWSG